MTNQKQAETTPCPHCGEIARHLGQCQVCKEPVCENCGEKKKDNVKHHADWCWNMGTPTRRNKSE